jgi:hypothetical protein
MRGLVTLGALAITGAMFAACGDDSGDTSTDGGSGGAAGHAGTSGTGGSAVAGSSGAAGAAGAAGTAGSGNGGTNAGTGGSGVGGADTGSGGASPGDPDAGDGDASTADAGDAGDAGGPPCTGCLELRANLTANDQTALFQIFTGSIDLSGETVTFRVRGLTLNDQLVASPFATDGTTSTGTDFTFGSGPFTQLNAGNGFVDEDTFTDVSIDISALSVADPDFDDTDVVAVGLQVGSAGAFNNFPFTEVVLVDSISFADVINDITFTDDEEGFALVTGVNGLEDAEVIHH